MIYILGFKSSEYDKTTPVRLAEDFGITCINSLKDVNLTREDYLVRYGLMYYPDKDYDCKRCVNKANNIKLAINKLLTTKILLQNNIPMPKVWFDSSKIKYKDLPVFRRLKNHSKGKDIIIVKRIKEFKDVQGDFYTQFVDSKREYRILVFGKSALRVQLKNKTKERRKEWIKNSENGYRFLNIYKHDIPMERVLIALAVRAVQVCGLDFGAVDLLVGKNNKPYVLEVNSAPRLNRSGRELFILHLFEKLKQQVVMTQFNRIKGNNRLKLPLRFVAKSRKKKKK